jgi:hypothetical protein
MLKRRNRTFKQQASQPAEPKYRRMAEIVRARIEARQQAEAKAEAERSRREEEGSERKPLTNGSADGGGDAANGRAAGCCAATDALAPSAPGAAEANGQAGSGVVKAEQGQAGGAAKSAEPEAEVPSEEALADLNDEIDGMKKQKSLLYFKLKEILRVEQVSGTYRGGGGGGCWAGLLGEGRASVHCSCWAGRGPGLLSLSCKPVVAVMCCGCVGVLRLCWCVAAGLVQAPRARAESMGNGLRQRPRPFPPSI